MLRFTLRDIFWLMLLAALLLTWWREGINLDSEKRRLQEEIRHATTERDSAVKQLRTNDPFYVSDGWHTIADPDQYEIGLDHETHHGGQGSAYIKAVALKPEYYATLLQPIRADEYRGKRIKLSAYLKTENADYTFVFLQFSRPGSGEILYIGSDQMIVGTGDWKQYDLVVDVPRNALNVAIGALARDGCTWLDDLKLEIVDSQVAVTKSSGPWTKEPRTAKNFRYSAGPRNLDFEN